MPKIGMPGLMWLSKWLILFLKVQWCFTSGPMEEMPLDKQVHIEYIAFYKLQRGSGKQRNQWLSKLPKRDYSELSSVDVTWNIN